jgi:hypothetical protein
MGIRMTDSGLYVKGQAHSEKLKKRLDTYFNECFEGCILSNLFIDPVFSNRVIRNVFHIGLPEVQNSIIDSCRNTPYPWVLLSLYFMQGVDEPPVVRMEFDIVVEDIGQELVQIIRGNN